MKTVELIRVPNEKKMLRSVIPTGRVSELVIISQSRYSSSPSPFLTVSKELFLSLLEVLAIFISETYAPIRLFIVAWQACPPTINKGFISIRLRSVRLSQDKKSAHGERSFRSLISIQIVVRITPHTEKINSTAF